MEGRVALLSAAPDADLRYRVQADLPQLGPWLGTPPAARGTLVLSGRVAGPLDALTADANLAGAGVEWPGVGAVSLTGHAALSGTTVRVDALRAGLAGGEVSGTGTVRLDGAAASSARVTWRDLDVARLARIAPLPVRVASSTTGEAALEWRRPELPDLRGQATATFAAPSLAPAALPVSGRIALTVAQGRWTLGLDQLVGDMGTIEGTLHGQLATGLADSTVLGQARIRITDAGGALTELDAAGYHVVDAGTAARIRGSGTVQVSVDGTLGSPQVRGTLRIADGWFDRTGPAAAQVAFEATTDRIAIGDLRAEVASSTLQGHGAIALATGALSGSATGLVQDVGRLIGPSAGDWEPQGSLRLETTLGGTLRNPTLDARLDARDVRVAGQPAASVAAHVRLVNHALAVDELGLDQTGGGRLSLTGQYDLARKRYIFDADAQDLVIVPVTTGGTALPPAAAPVPSNIRFPIDARLALQLHGQGSLASPQLAGAVDLARLTWGTYQVGAARVGIEVSGGRAVTRLELPAVHATATATLGLDPRTFDLDASLAAADLSTLLRSTGPAGPADSAGPLPAGASARNVHGTTTVHARAAGRFDNLTAATADLELSLTDASVAGLNVRADRPVHIRYAGRQLLADDVVLGVGASTLSVTGHLGADPSASAGLRAALVGPLSDFDPLLQMVSNGKGPQVSGSIDLGIEIGGSLRAPDLSGALSLTDASVGVSGWPPVSQIALQSSFNAGVLEIQSARAEWQGAQVTASGRLPIAVLGRDNLPTLLRASIPAGPATARAELRVASATPAMLAPFLGAETLAQLDGRVDLNAVVQTTAFDLADVVADVTLEQAELTLAQVPIAQSAPTRLHLAGGRLDVVQWTWAGAGNRLDVAGSVSLIDPAAALNLGVSGSIDLRLVGAFAPGWAASGTAALDVKATGALGNPSLTGSVTVAGADVASRSPRLAITGLHGTASFDRNQIRLRDVAASVNGGTIQADGGLDYRGLSITGGSIALHARGLALSVPEDLRTAVDADLTLAIERGQPSLTGRVTILRGAYRKPVSLAELVLGGNATFPAASLETEPGFLDRLQLGIALVSENDVVIDNNYSRLDVGANLRVLGTVGQPAMAGRLTVREGGQVFLGGRTYDVQRGTVDFTNPSRIEPNLDSRARDEGAGLRHHAGDHRDARDARRRAPQSRPEPGGHRLAAPHRAARD